jgi:hypothetical protein
MEGFGQGTEVAGFAHEGGETGGGGVGECRVAGVAARDDGADVGVDGAQEAEDDGSSTATSRMASWSSMTRMRPAPSGGRSRGASSSVFASDAAGSQKRKVVPRPGFDSTTMRPPCFLMME